ncbi:hypothetical protein B296_00036610 [Ensete ventricosum]|uniref:Uncharacterized protein n=1 Tax=Ensete ventricosum TaxID=4639 RepID=A0A426Y0N7_ENSVE|nr:hypothetical protein B296_00036610 [Ensete ventricosum]
MSSSSGGMSRMDVKAIRALEVMRASYECDSIMTEQLLEHLQERYKSRANMSCMLLGPSSVLRFVPPSSANNVEQLYAVSWELARLALIPRVKGRPRGFLGRCRYLVESERHLLSDRR